MTTPASCTGTFCDTINVTIVGVNEQEVNFPVAIFPNPATDQLNVNCYFNSTETITIDIMDLSGRVLSSEKFAAQAGAVQKMIAIDQLASGTYLLRIKAKNASAHKVFIKQ
jgi:hypothetical protein